MPFSARELLNVAIGIEHRGIAFYDVMARSMDNEAVRGIFDHLAKMERRHIQVFQGILDALGDGQEQEVPTGEHADYIRGLIDSGVFSDEMVAAKLEVPSYSYMEALELAIGIEKDSVLFYYEMRDMMAGAEQHEVNKVIAEEKWHLRQLSDLRKKLRAL